MDKHRLQPDRKGQQSRRAALRALGGAPPEAASRMGARRPAMVHGAENAAREERRQPNSRRAGRQRDKSGRSILDAAVLPLDSPAITLATGGGKGANLSQLSQAGFPVPPGFLITTSSYHSFVQTNDLRQQILRLATDATRDKDFERASATIRGLFTRGTIPPDVATAIREAYATLSPDGAPASLAIRSSATAEDLPEASFAGQQETYLHVQGDQAVLEAVQRCWSSLWTARALAYRSRQGIDPAMVSLAVVAQEMVPADVAGVLFTANPLTGAHDEVVIDAAWGLGEAIVGGLVTPDHFVVDKATGAIKEAAVADKLVKVVPTAAGTAERPVPVESRRELTLDAAAVARLTSLGNAIEADFGAPQDIEWCLAGDQFFIVQSRPITTLPEEGVDWASPIPGTKWLTNLLAAEWAKEPLSPLGATTTFPTMVAARERSRTWPPGPKHKAPWYALINGWLYIRSDHDLPSLMGWMIGSQLGKLVGQFDGHKYVQLWWPWRLATLEALEQVDLATVEDPSLRAHTDRLLEQLGWWWWQVSWCRAIARWAEQIIGDMRVPGLDHPSLLFGGNDSLLLEAERALRLAAETNDADAYLARFGHFVESADPIDPTLRESPEHLRWQLASARRDGADPDERLARARRERAEAEAALSSLRGFRGYVARRALRFGQSYAAHVDDAVFHFQRVLAALRAAFLERGRRLAQSGTLARAEDVFYLERDELWAPDGDLAGRVAERRNLRERQKRLAPPAFIPPLTDPAWARDPIIRAMPPGMRAVMFDRGLRERNGRRVLVGSPSSPGRARGIARIITGPQDFDHFQPGDVLVAHATAPIWTPLFGIASAAVTEVGGPVSHAAIVAREFGIPLVDGALDATRVIADGAPIVVDGSAGIVEL